MDLLREIGPILGFVAFGGLVILAFLTFQQARHLRRLRDWAGRQPERAAAEAEAIAERAGEVTIPSIREEETGPSRLDRLRGSAAVQYEELDRRSPVDPRILTGGLLAVLIGSPSPRAVRTRRRRSAVANGADHARAAGPKRRSMSSTARTRWGVGVEGPRQPRSTLVKASRTSLRSARSSGPGSARGAGVQDGAKEGRGARPASGALGGRTST